MTLEAETGHKTSQEPLASDANQPKAVWNSLEVAKLLSSMMTPVVIAILGFMINSSFRAADQMQTQQQEDARRISTKQNAVFGFSKFIYERRVRAELLSSALVRHANGPTPQSRDDFIDRKRKYDEAYANWNTNNQANLLLIRQILGDQTYSDFENVVESRLVMATLVLACPY